MKLSFRFLLLLSLTIALNGRLSSQNNQNIDQLSRYIEDARVMWNVPGVAVGIIYNDSIVLLKGYGEREVGKKIFVDENTLFAVASNTKSFTATAIGMLVDEGKLKWDDLVTKHISWFQLYDPYVTMNLTIRDLLCHRSGLTTFSGDLIWYGSTHSREDILRRAANLLPKHGFRAEYGYSNIMYLAAGQVIENVSGKSWDDFIKERILLPLAMNHSNTSTLALDLKGNTAIPHNDVEDKVIAIQYLNWDNIGPAGSINSSASDMLKWLKLQLDNGVANDQQLVSKKVLREMWSPQTIQKVSPFSERTWPSTHFKSYGLGWALMDYHGKKIISHSGGYDGMISYSAFVPESKLGFVILTNKNSSLYMPLAYKIMDTFLSTDTFDWSSHFYELIKKNEEASKKEEADKLSAKADFTSPTLPLENFCGTYSCKIYGEVKVELNNKELYIHFLQTPIFHSPLKHLQYNTFSIKFPDVPSLPSGKVAFILGMDNSVDKLLIDVPNPDFDFTELDLIKIK
jgi:CubicO group peptidase (beta-lactamase class C family)